MEQVFTAGRHLEWFHDGDDAVQKVRHWLPREAERRRIAATGHRLVMERHQYYHRVGQLLSTLGNRAAMPDVILRPVAAPDLPAAEPQVPLPPPPGKEAPVDASAEAGSRQG